MMNEIITKADQTANLLVCELEEAHREALAVCRQEGHTLRDRALAAYLGERLAIAKKLESDLLRLR
jgi:hypothetical protein